MLPNVHTPMDPMTPDLAKELVSSVDRMQAFPASVHSILKLTSDAACSPKALVEVIDKDPIVTVKILRVVNSVYYSLPRRIVSVNHAVVLLGFNTIKNLALSIAVVGMLPSNPLAGFDGQRYLLHSLTAAGVARQLAPRFAQSDAHDFFIAGLLHDFGKVVVAQVMPAEFRRALEYSLWHETSLHTALLAVVGVDHAEIGAMLLEKWRFPAPLVQAIRQQLTVDATSSDLTVAVFAANQICKHLGVDFGGSPLLEALDPAIEQRLGGTLVQVMESMGDMEPLLQEARRFSRM